MRKILELVTQDTNAVCKAIPIMPHGSARALYHNLKSGFILHVFFYLNSKLISPFSKIIHAKKITHKALRYHTTRR